MLLKESMEVPFKELTESTWLPQLLSKKNGEKIKSNIYTCQLTFLAISLQWPSLGNLVKNISQFHAYLYLFANSHAHVQTVNPPL